MEFLSLNDVNISRQNPCFKESALFRIIMTLLLLAVPAGIFYLYKYRDMPLPMAILTCLGMLVFILFAFRELKMTLGPANWLVVIEPGRMLIKYRSYYNAYLGSDDLQVVALNSSEIKSANITIKTLSYLSTGGRTTTEYLTFLDLTLSDDGLTELEEALKNERLTVKESSKTFRAIPIKIIETDTIRIGWRSARTKIKPNITKAIKYLQRQRITIEPTKRLVEDLTKSKLSKRKAEDTIIRLVEDGKKIPAVRLARQTYNYSLAEAKEFVDSLTE